MNENGQNMNSQEYTYSGNQGQVFAPAPERHQTTTTIDGVNRFGRYVNNEYMSNAQTAGNTYHSDLSSEIAAKAEEERLRAAQAQNVAQVQPEVPAQPAAPVQPAPALQPATPVQPAAPAFEASPIQQNPQPVQPAAAPQPVAPVFEASPIRQNPQPVQPASPQPVAPQPVAPAKPQPQKPEKNKEKKSKPFGIRLLLMAASGLVFGLVAGGVILAMLHFLPNKLKLVNNNPTIVTSENPSENPGPVTSEITSEGGTILAADPDGGIEGTNVTEEMTVPEIAEACMPAVVIINTKVDYNYYGMVQEAAASGTGVIVGQNDENLFIATNYHVVADAKEISVQFCDASTANAEVKGKKVSNDLAVITVKMDSLGGSTKSAIKLAQIGTSADLVVGESCVAIGNALGYGQSVTYGVISALNREMLTENGEKGVFIQTDAAINHGNSGGALLNMKGQLIGINSNKLDGSSVESMGYAIPIDTARPIIEKLIEKKELEELPAEQQSYFGISGYTVKSGSRTNSGVPIPVGIYVRSVTPGSPADKGGIQAGDIVTEFEGESVVSTTELMQYLASYPSGAEVTITYRRFENGQFNTYETKVTLEDKKTTNP